MDVLLQDLKHSLRTFVRSPGFTLAAIAALALGIGANTAIFSVVNAVLLKPVPFPDPDRFVFVMTTAPGGSFPAGSPAKFAHYRRETGILDDVSAFRMGVVNYTGAGTPEQLRNGQVSADYFRLAGIPISQGRTFTREEDLPNGPHVVVLSQGLWKRRFGSDPAVIGRTMQLSGDPYVIIGVMNETPKARVLEPNPEVWTPFQLDPNSSDQGNYFQVLGRLKPGVTLEQANARMKIAGQEFNRRFPNGLQPGSSFGVERFQDVLVRGVRSSLVTLVVAVTFVLLIACANVANLLLVRATGRKREMAVRAALGAGRGRILRQLLTESIMLSVAGGAVGLALGLVGIRALLSINTAGLPLVGIDGAAVGIDWRVVLYTFLVSIGTGVVFGLIPALHASRQDLVTNLKESAGRSGTGFRQNKVRSVLVVAEIALALILLVGSALLIRTTLALRAVNPGFDPNNVLTMRMSLSGTRYMKSDAVNLLFRESIDRLRALPGVESASATCCIPLEGGYGLPFTIVGRPLDKSPFHGGGGWQPISAGYFDVFKIAVKRGRAFTDRDDGSAPPVMIINERMAKQYWQDKDPVHERIRIGAGQMRELADEPTREIIGVVSDLRDGGLNNDPGPRMYVPNGQVTDGLNALNLRISPVAWIVRTRVEPYSLSLPIQEQLRQVMGLPVSDVRSMNDVVSRSISRQRFNMTLMTVFGAAALALAAIGIYGLMAYSVAQRTQEIGIRLALGADGPRIRNMVVLQGVRLAAVGVVIGLGSAFGLARLVASLLFGVKAWDPAVFVSVPIVLAFVALAAVWLPALRASRVDPIVALRDA
jgi:putative ABC transport system permease protein